MLEDAPERANAAVLEFDEVHKRFRSPSGEPLHVLDGISFAIRPNRFTALVGPSGCGKTTLMQLAAGLDVPTTGETRYMGRRVTEINQNVGYITQKPNLFPWYTMRQNVEFPLVLRGMAAEKRAEKLAEFLEIAQLEGFEDHYPHQLSGGMQQRAAIIRTLIYSPSVVLMDEPFGSLDAQTRMLMQHDLLRLWDQQQTTVLFITHDLGEAVALSDEIILLSKRPTRIKETIEVSIPRPRNIFEPYEMPEFVSTYDRVWGLFKSEVVPVQREVC